MKTNYKDAFKVKTLPKSQVEIEGELSYEELKSERTQALTSLGKNIKLDGFRQGHVPAPVLEKHLGEMVILEEMARLAIAHAYPMIVEELELKVIGQPEIKITKLAPNNPLGLSIIVSAVPEIKLPDYKSISKEINKKKPDDKVSDEELGDKIKEIQKQKHDYDRLQNSTEKTDGSSPKSKDGESVESKKENGNNDELPELTDEYVKTLGQPGQFNSVEDFKAKLREHLEIEKKRDNASSHRAKIIESVLEKTDLEIPQILTDYELNQMLAQLESDLERGDVKMEDYLTHIKKTKDDLKKEWLPSAEKRAKSQLILNEIAKVERITPDQDELKKQTSEILKLHTDATREAVESYVANIMINDLVMKFLEEL